MTSTGILTRRIADGWSRLGRRERLLSGGLLAVLAAYGLVVGVALPLLAARQAARASIAQYDAALDRLSAAPAGTSATEIAFVPVPTVLTDTAPSYGLAIRRLESDGEAAQVLLDNADFASVVLWLEELERVHLIGVVTADIDRTAEPGIVTARLGLSR